MTEIGHILVSLGQEKNGKFDEFARMIEEENKIHNLTRIVGLEQMRVRHFEDSLAVLGELEKLSGGRGLRIIDIGSGAGLPGLAIAIAKPEWRVVSVDGTGKKIRFQEKVIRELGLKNAEAMQGRAEEMGRDKRYRGKFDAATARAVGILAKVAEFGLPLVRGGGKVFAWKGPGAAAEIEGGKSTIAMFGGGEITEVPYRLVMGSEEFDYRLVILEKKKV
jgi:16S rRNA (guanine527-N7)-methyltransferase